MPLTRMKRRAGGASAVDLTELWLELLGHLQSSGYLKPFGWPRLTLIGARLSWEEAAERLDELELEGFAGF